MTIGEKILAEIIKQGMVSAYDVNGPIERPVIFVWNGNSDEQLDALVADHVETCLLKLRDELHLAQGAYAQCNDNLSQALCELEKAREQAKAR